MSCVILSFATDAGCRDFSDEKLCSCCLTRSLITELRTCTHHRQLKINNLFIPDLYCRCCCFPFERSSKLLQTRQPSLSFLSPPSQTCTCRSCSTALHLLSSTQTPLLFPEQQTAVQTVGPWCSTFHRLPSIVSQLLFFKAYALFLFRGNLSLLMNSLSRLILKRYLIIDAKLMQRHVCETEEPAE